MVKYYADQEITNIYENLQIVWSQFFTDTLLFVYIQSTSNIYWFIVIQIRCWWIQTNSYSVTFDYSQYSVQHLMNNPEGKKTTIRHYLATVWTFRKVKLVVHVHVDGAGPAWTHLAEVGNSFSFLKAETWLPRGLFDWASDRHFHGAFIRRNYHRGDLYHNFFYSCNFRCTVVSWPSDTFILV